MARTNCARCPWWIDTTHLQPEQVDRLYASHQAGHETDAPARHRLARERFGAAIDYTIVPEVVRFEISIRGIVVTGSFPRGAKLTSDEIAMVAEVLGRAN